MSSTHSRGFGTEPPKTEYSRVQQSDETTGGKWADRAAAGKLFMANAQSTSVASSQTKHRSFMARILKDSWVWEILGALLSILCMAAVVLLGLYIDDSSLSEWKLNITPGTMISALITLGKTSIMLPVAEGISQLKWIHFGTKKRPLNELEAFDDASRGPWGSLMLLWKIKLQSTLALCGAFLTIAMLAMGPFSQQIVSFRSRTIPRANATASILVSNAYDSGTFSGVEGNAPQSKPRPFSFYGVSLTMVLDKAADVRMQGAVFNAIFDLSSSPFDFVCPSGSCTWPDFASFAVCSQCANVTSSTQFRNEEDRTVIITPGGISIDFMLDPSQSERRYNGSVRAEIRGSEIAGDIASYAAAQLKTPTTVAAEEAQWDITECELAWCVKRYSDVKVVSLSSCACSHVLLTNRGSKWQVEGSIQRMQVEDIPLQKQEVNEDGDDDAEFWNLVPNATADSQDGREALPPFKNSTFLLSRSDDTALKEFLANVIKVGNPAIMIGNALEYPANMTSLIINTTDSMTNAVRTGRNATRAQGTIWDPGTYIVVQWPWLILPILLILFSTLFLVIVMLFTSKRNMPLWKSALLPFIFHGLEPDDLGEGERRKLHTGRLEMKYEMEQKAKEISARLWRNENGETRLTRR